MRRVKLIGRGSVPMGDIAPRLRFKTGAERAFICGKTGSGKSYLAKRLLSLYGPGVGPFNGNIVIVDPNCTFKFPADQICEEPDQVRVNSRNKVIVYRPSPYNLDTGSWNNLFERLFNADVPRLLTYVDEVYALNTIFGNLKGNANWFKAYLTRGRSIGRGAIMVAQRPRHIPLDIIGQAEHFCMFGLPIADDRKLMGDTLGKMSYDGEDITLRSNLSRYQFWYMGPGLDVPHKMQASR